MQIFPAIDLQGGQCVRLTQGDFATARIYESDPLLQARKFAEAGATWLHVVDLDGARDGGMAHFDVIAGLVRETTMNVQVGGGIRDTETIEKLVSLGVARVVIGSLAVQKKDDVKDWLARFTSERITLAFDIRMVDNEPEVLTHGWQSGSRQWLWDVLDSYETSGLKHILCTDVSRDGMLEGTNHALYESILVRWPHLQVLASGGVNGLADVTALARLKLAGVIVGKALYENRFGLADALGSVRDAG